MQAAHGARLLSVPALLRPLQALSRSSLSHPQATTCGPLAERSQERSQEQPPGSCETAGPRQRTDSDCDRAWRRSATCRTRYNIESSTSSYRVFLCATACLCMVRLLCLLCRFGALMWWPLDRVMRRQRVVSCCVVSRQPRWAGSTLLIRFTHTRTSQGTSNLTKGQERRDARKCRQHVVARTIEFPCQKPM